MHSTVVIVGLGEVGKPLLEIMKSRYQTFGVDINQPASVSQCDVMHICFPFQNDKFVRQVVEYIHRYRPALTVINSTVAPGTTRSIAVESGTAVVNSPVRGKHTRMQEELLRYTKFVGALDPQSGQRAVEHFEAIGMKATAARVSGGERDCQAHRNHIFRLDDRVGTGDRTLLRKAWRQLRRSRVVLRRD